jgi:UDP-GlcNAc:undecaprenyl-phosphate GlcNAc-1-phosphate transferase
MLILPAGILLLGAAAFLLARLGTALSIEFAKRRSILALKNERTSHELPTPRIGGVGIVTGMAGATIVAWILLKVSSDELAGGVHTFLTEIPRVWWLAGAASVGVVFIVGLLDDLYDLPAIPKLGGQALAAAIPPLLGIVPHTLDLPFRGVVEVSSFVGGILAFGFAMLMINVVNFMDGINGLAGRLAQLPLLAILVAIPVDRVGGFALVLITVISLLAIEGFLGFNEFRPRTFMGDCGSHALGALLSWTMLLMIAIPALPVIPTVAVLMLVAIPTMDVLVTVLRRQLEGKKITQAHREHFYQRYLVANGENHNATRLFYVMHAAIPAACAGALIARPDFAGRAGVLGALIAFTLLACVSYVLQTRMAEGARK